MNLVEYAEKISPIPLSEWQKQYLATYEQAKREHKQLVVIVPPRTNGRRMLMQIIEELERNAMLLPPKQESTKSKRCTLTIDGEEFAATVEEHQTVEFGHDEKLKRIKFENIYRIYHLDKPYPYLKSGMFIVTQDSTQVRKCYMSDDRMRLIEY